LKQPERTSGVQRRRWYCPLEYFVSYLTALKGKSANTKNQRTGSLTVHIISRSSGKPAIALAASKLLRDANNINKIEGRRIEFSIEPIDIGCLIEGNFIFSCEVHAARS
jgi:hypothetical protein